MADIAGVNIPDIQFGGILSNTWFYIVVIFIVGLLLIGIIVLLLYLKTWNKKCKFYENVSGAGYQEVAVRRARVVKLGVGGDEILKPRGFTGYLTAYGRKVGRNTYMFVKGQDGYWYNAVHGDFEGKRNMLDIEPIDRDVRMFHVAMDRITHSQYGDKKGFMERYGNVIISFTFLIILIVGMYVLIGKLGDSNKEIVAGNERVADKLDRILGNPPSSNSNSGLADATSLEGGGGGG